VFKRPNRAGHSVLGLVLENKNRPVQKKNEHFGFWLFQFVPDSNRTNLFFQQRLKQQQKIIGFYANLDDTISILDDNNR
jgi:hypothetical protein